MGDALSRRTRDDEGTLVRPISVGDVAKAARSDRPEVRHVAQRVRAAIRAETKRTSARRFAISGTFVVGVFFANGCITVCVELVFGFYPLLLPLLSLIGLIVLATFLYKWIVRREVLPELMYTAVSSGVCGSCAFSLEGLETDERGLVRCPECNAAWRASRITRPCWDERAPKLRRRLFLGGMIPGVRSNLALWAPDASGRYVEVPDARLMRLPRDRVALLDRDERARVHGAIWQNGRGARAACAALFLATAAMCTLAGVQILREDEFYGAITIFAAVAAPFWIAMLLMPHTSLWIPPRKVTEVVSREGRCGSCLSPRDSWEQVAPGLAACSYCGATWRRDA